MRQWQSEIVIATEGRGLYEMTVAARQFVRDSGIGLGQLTFFIRHTSASLLIQEAADPNVGRDLQEFLSQLVPEETPWFQRRALQRSSFFGRMAVRHAADRCRGTVPAGLRLLYS